MASNDTETDDIELDMCVYAQGFPR